MNVIDHGMSPQEAVEAPRIWTLGEDLEMETGYPQRVRTTLKQRGHTISELPIIGGGMGKGMKQGGATGSMGKGMMGGCKMNMSKVRHHFVMQKGINKRYVKQ